jgi:RNA polymerase sigma-70 factor (ECF subfamily)
VKAAPDPPRGEAESRYESFASTRWSIVLEAGNSATVSAHAFNALSELCQIYWRPLYSFLRRQECDAEDARDLIQGFFADLIETRAYARANREKGRFRSFLLGTLKHFVADMRDRGRALKRGGGMILMGLDDKATAEAEAQIARTTKWQPEKSTIASGQPCFCGKRWIGSRKSARSPAKQTFLVI